MDSLKPKNNFQQLDSDVKAPESIKAEVKNQLNSIKKTSEISDLYIGKMGEVLTGFVDNLYSLFGKK